MNKIDKNEQKIFIFEIEKFINYILIIDPCIRAKFLLFTRNRMKMWINNKQKSDIKTRIEIHFPKLSFFPK